MSPLVIALIEAGAALVVLALLVSLIRASHSLAPWHPTRSRDLRRIADVAALREGEIFYELGCGDGRVARTVATRYPKARILGVDMALPCYLWCIGYDFFAGAQARTNRYFVKADILKTDLSNADVIFMYLLPDKIKEKLLTKLEKEMKPGARIVSYTFEIEGLEPQTVDRPRTEARPIYIYSPVRS